MIVNSRLDKNEKNIIDFHFDRPNRLRIRIYFGKTRLREIIVHCSFSFPCTSDFTERNKNQNLMHVFVIEILFPTLKYKFSLRGRVIFFILVLYCEDSQLNNAIRSDQEASSADCSNSRRTNREQKCSFSATCDFFRNIFSPSLQPENTY